MISHFTEVCYIQPCFFNFLNIVGPSHVILRKAFLTLLSACCLTPAAGAAPDWMFDSEAQVDVSMDRMHDPENRSPNLDSRAHLFHGPLIASKQVVLP